MPQAETFIRPDVAFAGAAVTPHPRLLNFTNAALVETNTSDLGRTDVRVGRARNANVTLGTETTATGAGHTATFAGGDAVGGGPSAGGDVVLQPGSGVGGGAAGSIRATRGPLKVEDSYLLVGSTTLPATRGDAAFGLSGGFQTLYDQSDGLWRMYDSVGTAQAVFGRVSDSTTFWGLGRASGITVLSSTNYFLASEGNISGQLTILNAPSSTGAILLGINNTTWVAKGTSDGLTVYANASPGARLDVRGSARFGASTNAVLTENDLSWGDATNFWFYDHSSQTIQWRPTSSGVFTCENSSNLNRQWARLYVTSNRGTFSLYDAIGSEAVHLEANSNCWLWATNLGINQTGSFGGGAGILAMANATTVPTSNVANTQLIYTEGGALKARSPSGGVTTLSPAEPHCPRCGRDCAYEWVHASRGRIAVCWWCLTETLERLGARLGEFAILREAS
ncbi:MAG: hypothetical protein L0216_11185 [Planctomycetales bacterium]|nr:hypothetical protein [Planctomycetales bacterium]